MVAAATAERWSTKCVAGNQRTSSLVTLDVTQPPMGWLKELAPLKVACV